MSKSIIWLFMCGFAESPLVERENLLPKLKMILNIRLLKDYDTFKLFFAKIGNM